MEEEQRVTLVDKGATEEEEDVKKRLVTWGEGTDIRTPEALKEKLKHEHIIWMR